MPVDPRSQPNRYGKILAWTVQLSDHSEGNQFVDLTVVAIPAYLGGMGAEYAWLKRTAAERGLTPGDYERSDTIASLTMGTASLLAPLIMGKVLAPITPGKGRYGKALVGLALGAVAVTTVADLVARKKAGPLPPAGVVPSTLQPGPAPAPVRQRTSLAQRVASSAAVTAIAAGGVAVATGWSARTTGRKMFEKRPGPDLGRGPLAVAGAIVAWDFIYYWNHRLSHESRHLWAYHVVHHSSQHYNLSTALRQPVADSFISSVPHGLLGLMGFSPDVIETARGVNLLYQFWIHTETIGSLGAAEKILNSPSLHRVHHGSNSQYLDRNHGGIFIIWDRLFGTHEVEDEPVIYGLTKNIETYNPVAIATHEYGDMFRDVSTATGWADRLSYVLRGPGWAYARRRSEEVTYEQAGPVPIAALA